jgi:DNA-binding response OmpR family regulator
MVHMYALSILNTKSCCYSFKTRVDAYLEMRIFTSIWHYDSCNVTLGDNKKLNVHMSRIKSKLKEADEKLDGCYSITKHCVGYMY